MFVTVGMCEQAVNAYIRVRIYSFMHEKELAFSV